MKLYDLKLREVQVLEKKIQQEKDSLARNPHHGVKMTKKQKKTKELKRKLHQEKAHVKATARTVAGHHSDLIVLHNYNNL